MLRRHGVKFKVRGMGDERGVSVRIREVLIPYASNWTGTLGRGDLVVPQRAIPQLIEDILDVLGEEVAPAEASEREVFEVLMAASRHASVQEQAAVLRQKFRLVRR
jgi:hypothetical protein